MNNDNALTRRMFLLLNAKIILFFILISKIFYIQVFCKKKYQLLSDKNRKQITYIIPQRGKILDIKRKVISSEKKFFELVINTNQNINYDTLISKIVLILKLQKLKNQLLTKIKNHPKHNKIVILNNMKWHDVVKIEENIINLKGVSIEIGNGREYQQKEMMAHIIGYVGLVNKREQKEYNLKDININIGKSGIEKQYENLLRGQLGLKEIQVDAFNKKKCSSIITQEHKGKDITLSINLTIQKYVSDAIKEYNGAVIIMESQTGNVVSLVSKPSFNPNNMISEIAKKKLNSSKKTSLFNKVTQGLYPPGSIFKIITFLTALENGINVDHTYYCCGKIKVGKNIFHCFKKEGHGLVNMEEAFYKSCNCYTYWLSQKLGAQKIIKIAKILNLDKKSEIDLPYERNSTFSEIENKINSSTYKWKLGDTINLSIGQGFICMNMCQILKLINFFATNGKIITPTLLNSASNKSITTNIKDKNIKIMKNLLYKVVNHPQGTGKMNRININGMNMCGKTGTAQVKRTSLNLNTKHKSHGIFSGYAPFDNPKYSMAIITENTGFASIHTVPIASKIFSYLLKNHI